MEESGKTAFGRLSFVGLLALPLLLALPFLPLLSLAGEAEVPMETVVEEGPYPWAPETLEKAGGQAVAIASIRPGWGLPTAEEVHWGLGLGLVAGLAIGWYLRRTADRWGRGRGDDTRRSRLGHLGQGLAWAVRDRAFSLAVPAALVGALELVEARDLPSAFLLEVALGLFAVYRLGVALFPVLLRPFESDDLAKRLDQPGVKRLWNAGRGLFAVTGVAAFLLIAHQNYPLPVELQSVVTLLLTLLALPPLWGLRHRAGWRSIGGAEAGERLAPARELALGLGRLLVAATALGLPALAATGHYRLAGFLLLNLLASILLLLAAGALATGLARGIGRLKQGRPPESLAPILTPDRQANVVDLLAVLVRGVVLLGGVLSVLALWQFPLERVWWSIRPVLFGFQIGQYEFSLVGLGVGLAVFLVVFYFGRWLRAGLHHRVLPRFTPDIGLRNSISSLVFYAVLVVGGFIAISAAGFDLTNLAIIAGALSVGIGFGLQNVINNFVSGLILLFERPIKVGDVVEYQGQWAEVLHIRVRSTVVRTYDRAELIVPNSELVSFTVTNWTHSDYRTRLIITVGVAYGSDTQQVRELLLQTAREHPGVYPDPEPAVFFRDFGDSALLFELRCFTHLDNVLTVPSDLRFRIDALFREHGITIPFPQRDVHFLTAPS
ncbi:mechanosensitive ion channel family protein [Thiohalorhabdus denitrificans]|uniref:Mechanosensitive ion channel n=1 Tax=Thiohalorhabdus denitrificans TaxID=381306 RepID=A0A1G5C823_9GAMM|nr:mechanosensitive ion channel domain-containing protein [Thiohalorhabdus denitrificans]SCX98444.1 Mechanosensitive ion channel [Thiohalorhabdus denitrificans]